MLITPDAQSIMLLARLGNISPLIGEEVEIEGSTIYYKSGLFRGIINHASTAVCGCVIIWVKNWDDFDYRSYLLEEKHCDQHVSGLKADFIKFIYA